jgi:hypothetical protein
MMLRSPQYLAFVRLEKCCAPGCSNGADHAHHFGRRHGGGGTGVKPHDSFVVPLCTFHHLYVHQHGALDTLGSGGAPSTESYFYCVALQLVTKFWLDRMASRKPGRSAEVF